MELLPWDCSIQGGCMFGNYLEVLVLVIGVSVAHTPSGTLKYPGKQQPERPQAWVGGGIVHQG